MIRRYTPSVILLASILFLSYDAITSTSGSPIGRTGSPASTGTCATVGCHSGPAVSSQTVSITTDIPASGFLDNTDYTITITANSNSATSTKIGFSASVESAAGHEGAVSVSGNALKRIGTSQFLTHTTSGTAASGGSRSWSFTWNSGTAPDQTTVYSAVNFSNSNGNTSGDVIATQTLVLSKDQSVNLTEESINTLSVYPNPAKNQFSISGVSERFSLRIFDLNGKQVLQDEITVDGQQISIGNLRSGHYLLFDDKGNFIQNLRVQ